MTDPFANELDELFSGAPEPPSQEMRYRQGTILEWNPLTLENKVRVGGATLTNLKVLGVAETATYKVGDVVGVTLISNTDNQRRTASTWAIIGRLVTPGTAAAQDALSFLSSRIYTATVATFETVDTGGTFNFVDPATPGPTLEDVLIGPSGRCLVIVSAFIQEFSNDIVRGGAMGFQVTGATTVVPDYSRSLIAGHTSDGFVDSSGGTPFSTNNRADNTAAVIPLTLNPGLHRFHALYNSRGSGMNDPILFGNRTLTVFAL